jgi:hypothetical protein
MERYSTTKEKFIYKYFTVNEYLLRSLINNELFFSNPMNFNDPFDCQFELNLISGSEAESELKERMALTPDEQELYNTTNMRDSLAYGLTQKFYEGLSKMIGVTCFTENPDNFLMWSHYANSHKGVCLKFDWNTHKEYFQGTKVVYDNKLPEARYESAQGFQNEIPKIVLTKLEHWSYENEIRSVVSINNGKRNISFDPSSLVGIIFGDNIEPENEVLLKRIVELHSEYDRVKFYRAKLNRKESKILITAN